MKNTLTDVRGIGPSTARALEGLGIQTVAELAEASADKVASAGRVARVPGFDAAQAARLIAAAGALLDATGARKATATKPAPRAAAKRATPRAVSTKVESLPPAPLLDQIPVAADEATPPSSGDKKASKKLKAKEDKKQKKKAKSKSKAKKQKKKNKDKKGKKK